jgi:DNA-binding LytR/AlgR family response regulator
MNELTGTEITGSGVKIQREDLRSVALSAAIPRVVAERGAMVTGLSLRGETPPVKPIKIAIKTKGKILLINPADILAVEAEGNYVLLQLQLESYLLRESISTMAEKFKAYGFIRIHRSVLVNSSWVEEIHPGTTGEYMLRMSGGREYMVSRTYKLNLKSLAQSWIGIDSFMEK